MKLSLEWIADYVDLTGITPELIADTLTLSTAEVEGVETVQRMIEGVVVGEIVSLRPLPSAAGKTLYLAEVDCGKEHYTTVSGAPNLKLGLKVPYAGAGVRIAHGLVQAEIVAGQHSAGVLCSPMELGLSHWHEGVLECPSTLDNGTRLTDVLAIEDILLEIDNKSLTNRPDLWGHYGFARELAAIFGRTLRPLPVADLTPYDHLPSFPVKVAHPENCPCYSMMELAVDQATSPSPLVMQARLHALGQRTAGLLVDVTNYVMLDLGQPTHAFDGHQVHAVRVAPMGMPGAFVTLDGQERAMHADDLMIWNECEPVAIAGIMGGRDSEIGERTTRVLLESANFTGARIRRTAQHLRLRTEACLRFEKDLPPANVRLATGRILQLLSDAGVTVTAQSRFTVIGDPGEEYRPLQLPAGYIASRAGADITAARTTAILCALGFKVTEAQDGGLLIGIPPHRGRQDISIPPDILEEVLRIYGYDNLTPCLPILPLQPPIANDTLLREHKAQRILAQAHRFIEVHTYAWMDDSWLTAMKYTPTDTLVLRNPSAPQKRQMRTSLLPNLFALVRQNRTHREEFRVFELGRVFRATDGGSTETSCIAGISFTRDSQVDVEDHFRAIKGAVEDLTRAVGQRQVTCAPAPAGDAVWQRANAWMHILCDGHVIGSIGMLTEPLRSTVAIEGQVIWFEIDLGQLVGTLFPQVQYEAAPSYPESWQDFSLLWDLSLGYVALEAQLASFTHTLITRREFLTRYRGKGLPPGMGSFTLRFWLGASSRTLTADDLDEFRTSFLAFLLEKGIVMR